MLHRNGKTFTIHTVTDSTGQELGSLRYIGYTAPGQSWRSCWSATDDRGFMVTDTNGNHADWATRSDALEALCDAVDTAQAPVTYPVTVAVAS